MANTTPPPAPAPADATKDIRDWLYYYLSLSQNLLNLGAMEPSTDENQSEENEQEEEHEALKDGTHDTPSTSTSTRRTALLRQRPSSVRFLESVSVRRLQVPADDADDTDNTTTTKNTGSDLYYTQQDFETFKHDHQQEQQIQLEQERKQAKQRERQERKLRLAQRKANRNRQQQQQPTISQFPTDGVAKSTTTTTTSTTTTANCRPCSGNCNLVLPVSLVVPIRQAPPTIG